MFAGAIPRAWADSGGCSQNFCQPSSTTPLGAEVSRRDKGPGLSSWHTELARSPQVVSCVLTDASDLSRTLFEEENTTKMYQLHCSIHTDEFHLAQTPVLAAPPHTTKSCQHNTTIPAAVNTSASLA